MFYEKSCGALIFYSPDQKSDGKMLLIQHCNGGHWSFPKGHVEGKETEVETALREIKEETGLSVNLLTGFRESVVYHPKAQVEKEVVYFLARSSTDHLTLQVEEISRGIWVRADQALQMVTYQNDRHLIQTAQLYFKKKVS